MKLFYSISQHPGTTGEYFYNSFFKKFNIDATYKALGSNTADFNKLLDSLRKTANGISISMPFKNTVLNQLTQQSLDVTKYDSCNTIICQDSDLIGYNTDIQGVIESVSKVAYNDKVLILGNGSMGKMFHKYMQSSGYTQTILVSRSLGNYDSRHQEADVLINCTSLGTINNSSPIQTLNKKIKFVIDLSVKRADLFQLCESQNIKYFSGMDFYKCQFKAQYLKYTGQEVDLDYFDYIAELRC